MERAECEGKEVVCLKGQKKRSGATRVHFQLTHGTGQGHIHWVPVWELRPNLGSTRQQSQLQP